MQIRITLFSAKAETKSVRRILRASTAVQFYAATKAHVTQELFTLFREQAFSSFFRREHVLAECPNQEGRSREDQFFAIGSQIH